MNQEDKVWAAVLLVLIAFCMWQIYIGTLHREW